jgi:hypothetical protein
VKFSWFCVELVTDLVCHFNTSITIGVMISSTQVLEFWKLLNSDLAYSVFIDSRLIVSDKGVYFYCWKLSGDIVFQTKAHFAK